MNQEQNLYYEIKKIDIDANRSIFPVRRVILFQYCYLVYILHLIQLKYNKNILYLHIIRQFKDFLFFFWENNINKKNEKQK
jgi:hypothetical protein